MGHRGSLHYHGWESTKGSLSRNSKLDEEQALSIYNDTREWNTIAEAFGVSHSTVCNIKHKRRWRHIHKQPEEE